MTAYLREITKAIEELHGVTAKHVETVPVTEIFRGQVAWEGEVEVFEIEGHSRAKKCHAWGAEKDSGRGWDITTVLEIPPVDSPQTAVKIAIAAAAKQAIG